MPSLPTTTFSTTTVRAVPGSGGGGASAATTRAAALALARDHVAIVQLNPLLARYERLSSGPVERGSGSGSGSAPEAGAGGKGLTQETYLITETMSYVPGTHLLDRDLSFELDVVDTAAGLRTVARAPMGFVSEQEWVVKEEGDGECVVEERVTATCPWGLRWFVEGTMRKSHETILARFVEKVAAEVKQEGRA